MKRKNQSNLAQLQLSLIKDTPQVFLEKGILVKNLFKAGFFENKTGSI